LFGQGDENRAGGAPARTLYLDVCSQAQRQTRNWSAARCWLHIVLDSSKFSSPENYGWDELPANLADWVSVQHEGLNTPCSSAATRPCRRCTISAIPTPRPGCARTGSLASSAVAALPVPSEGWHWHRPRRVDRPRARSGCCGKSGAGPAPPLEHPTRSATSSSLTLATSAHNGPVSRPRRLRRPARTGHWCTLYLRFGRTTQLFTLQ